MAINLLSLDDSWILVEVNIIIEDGDRFMCSHCPTWLGTFLPNLPDNQIQGICNVDIPFVIDCESFWMIEVNIFRFSINMTRLFLCGTRH